MQKTDKSFTKTELFLWIGSVLTIVVSFLLLRNKDYLSLSASLIGVTSLIFIAKGKVIGQLLMIVFSVFYGLISYYFRYYGEMITYLAMTAPMAVLSMIAWIKNPSDTAKEVKVNQLGKRHLVWLFLLTIFVTAGFYFILDALDTANIVFSTISVATSFIAAYLTFFRSAFYAIGYALNDIVLIVLWVLATLENSAYLSMVLCFSIFLINDLYGFINWKRMKKSQSAKAFDGKKEELHH